MTSSFRKVTRILALGIVAAALVVGRAEAATITVVPSNPTPTVGSNLSVDLLVSGLAANQSVGGVSLLLSFNSTILKGTGFTLDPNAKMGFALNPALNDFGSSFGAAGTSPFTAFFLADASLNDAALRALQGVGFRLATLNFTAIGVGFSGLNLSVEPTQGIFLSDGFGNALGTQAINGSVCVGNAAGVPANCNVAAVPEPGTIALLGSGLVALVRRRRKAQAEV